MDHSSVLMGELHFSLVKLLQSWRALVAKDLKNSSFKTIQGRVTVKCSGTPSGMCPALGRLGHGRGLWEQNCQHSWELPSPFALVATKRVTVILKT